MKHVQAKQQTTHKIYNLLNNEILNFMRSKMPSNTMTKRTAYVNQIDPAIKKQCDYSTPMGLPLDDMQSIDINYIDKLVHGPQSANSMKESLEIPRPFDSKVKHKRQNS